MSNKSYLKNLHTKKLLKLLQETRHVSYYDTEAEPPFTAEEIKEELATREHIPNKKEAKKIRQEKAKSKKSR